MIASVMLLALALAQPEPEKAVTAAEKEAFLELLATLPTRGEFYTEEGVTKAVPFTRVLLAMTPDDIKDNSYPMLALSAGLLARKEARAVVLKNFDRIAHPILKLSVAVDFVRQPEAPPPVVALMRKALKAPEDAKMLAEALGPKFPEFEKSFNEAFV